MCVALAAERQPSCDHKGNQCEDKPRETDKPRAYLFHTVFDDEALEISLSLEFPEVEPQSNHQALTTCSSWLCSLDPNLPRQGRQADWWKQPPRPTRPGARGAALPPPNPHADPGSAQTGAVRLPVRGDSSSSTLRPSRETAAAAAAALGKAGMVLRGRGGGRGGSDCMWGCTGGRRRRSGGSAFFTIIIIISFYLWRRKAPQLLLPESSSSSPPLSLSLPQSLPGACGTSRARPDLKENRAGGGGGDQRPRDHARAVTAAASCRAPSPRSTSNNPAARAPRTLVRRRPPGLEAARARNALALGAQSMGPCGARRGE
ncbi:uncharacterized protein LOC125102189 [Lutra lutra]|uniref:uncharacterized protein LOC125102189 n=1 Tax=Lutra lutra TaxID=9657 RepID=UPI001FD09F7E|nr:uncharacterized protein LOC125102189 [Lutra lutra]